MKKILFLTFVAAILLFSCAKPNKPFTPTESNLKTVNFYPTTGYARDFSILKNHLFVAEDQSGFAIFDLNSDTLIIHFTENIQNARLISAVERDTTSTLVVYDTFGGPASLMLYDISDVSNPILFSNIIENTGGIETMVASVVNDTLNISLSRNSSGTHEFKISELIQIYGQWFLSELLTNSNFDYDVHNFSENNGKYYIGNEQNGIAVLDEESGDIQEYIDTPGSAYDVKKSDNYLFVADRHEGFEVYKADTKEMIYHYDTSGYAKQLEINDKYAVVASGGGGIYVFDISNPEEVSLIGRIDDSEIGYTYKAKIVNDKIFVATRNGVYELGVNN